MNYKTIRAFDVIYDKPGSDHFASMPSGNGDIAINCWTENSKDIVLLIAKNDAWEESSVLCKIGKVRISIPTEIPIHEDANFSQRLNLYESEITIKTSEDELKIWVDANNPVIHFECHSKTDKKIMVNLEWYRKEDCDLPWKTRQGSIFRRFGDNGDLYESKMYKDTLSSVDNAIVWYHCNKLPENDGVKINMELQGLKGYLDNVQHPLTGRTFGAWIEGENLINCDDETLQSKKDCNTHNFSIVCTSEFPSSGEQWLENTKKKVELIQQLEKKESVALHKKWWEGFWNRSYISITGEDKDAYLISQAYQVQRYQNACSSRGDFPIKFNGGLWTTITENNSYDFREWGDAYWWQNTRQIYWPMFTSGDFDLMECFFNMYHNALDLCTERTKKYYDHPGAHYSEIVFWWGCVVSSHYGWEPFEEREQPEESCRYLTYYFQGSIERVLMMHEYWLYTQDEKFAKDILIPHAEQITLFYDHHYPRKNGKIHFHPSQALETWQDSTNPTPEVAGLRYLLNRLLKLPQEYYLDNQNERWQRMLDELPEVPTREIEGQKAIAPADRFEDEKNVENPELYAVFPYRIFGMGKDELEVGRTTMEHRINRQQYCWCQNEIQQAYLGLTKEAKEGVIERVKGTMDESKFPTNWKAFYDSAPCQDHGGSFINALQTMLVQCEGKEIRLFPAWPKEWNVEFKINAPYKTTVSGTLLNGEIKDLKVEPDERKSDIVIQYEETYL
jgi:alpha-L-fucosidase 2